MVICLVHMAQLMPLQLTATCFSKIQIGFTFLILAHLVSPGKGQLNGCFVAVVVNWFLLCGMICCSASTIFKDSVALVMTML